MEMSNPKGQHLESVFPLPWGTGCFSPAIEAAVYPYLYLHSHVYLWARRGQSPGGAEVPGDGHGASAQRQPLPHRICDLGELDLSVADAELKYTWPSAFPKPAEEAPRDWTQRQSPGLQRGQPMLSEAEPQQNSLPRSRAPCLTPNSSRLVKAHVRRCLSSSCRVCARGGGRLGCPGTPPSPATQSGGNLLLPHPLLLSQLLQALRGQRQAAWITINGYSLALFGTAKELLFLRQRLVTVKKIIQSPKKTWIQGEFIKIHKSPVRTVLLRITVGLLWLM